MKVITRGRRVYFVCTVKAGRIFTTLSITHPKHHARKKADAESRKPWVVA